MVVKQRAIKILFLVLAVIIAVSMVACSEITAEDNYPYTVLDNEVNKANIDTTTKDQAVDLTSTSIRNLKEYLQSATAADVGYYMEFDFLINTENGSNFRMKFRANLYTYPYSQFEEGSAQYQAALAVHNKVIKKSDLLIEWYDGQSNELLIGFYFDGENASVTDPGNNLYLNLQGSKRFYANFGDTVLFQQLIRLITQLDVDTLLANNNTSIDDSIDTLSFYLAAAVTTNYKVTRNGETTSIYYDSVNLNVIVEDVTDILTTIFSPFENKIDPLTNKYLRFKFSTLGQTEIRTLSSDMRFLTDPDNSGTKQVLSGFQGAFVGTALSGGETVPFTSDVSLKYSTRVSSEIEMDLTGYTQFLHGQYQFTGDLFIPMLNTTFDVRIFTSLNEYDNSTNKIDARFYDRSTQDAMLMFFYENELLYINTQGLDDMYGGAIKLEDIGFPMVYLPDINLASILQWFYDSVNNGIVSIVDSLLDPNTYQGEVEGGLVSAVMRKVVSEGDTMTLTVDHELIKDVLRYTTEVDPEAEIPLDKNGNPIYTLDDKNRPMYTTSGLVYILEDVIGYDLDEIAAILGIQSAEKLIENTWFEIMYNVETGIIRVEMFSSVRKTRSLIFRLNLKCIIFGEEVTFPDNDEPFQDYNPLGEVKTLAGTIAGTIKFSSNDDVDLSPLLGTMIGDKSGLNTVYYASPTATLDFHLVVDQYIKYSEDDENLNAVLDSIANEGVAVDYESIANSTRGRMAFFFTLTVSNMDGTEDLVIKLFAYNVSFNKETYKKIEAGETLEGYGYVYVDLSGGVRPTLTDIPLVAIREDVFLDSLNNYLNTSEQAENASTLSLASIISALMEDAIVIFTDDYIGITTANTTVQRLFGVDDLVANFRADLGLRKRITGQYNINQNNYLEENYAHYTVAELDDLTVDSFYDSAHPIHKTLAVTFTWADGAQRVVDMLFNYYRVAEPVLADYETQEDYDEAYEIYLDYITNYNLTLVAGKAIYTPKVDGPFMGVERFYTLSIVSSTGDSVFATAIITGYATEIVLEPLDDKPNTILCDYANTATTGSALYAANFLLDWTSVTVDGLPAAYYDVIIGQGSLGEFTARVRITVENRRIVNSDGSASETVFVLTADGERAASVAATYNIDPYEYILARYNNSSLRGIDNNYITTFLRNTRFTLYFASGKEYPDTFLWYFDPIGGMNVETAIREAGGTVYVHTTFRNQVIALRLVVMPKQISHIAFPGEIAQNTYTVDVLDTGTWTIPTQPTIHFTDGSSRRFPFSLTWSAGYASNVSLNGANRNSADVECPFPGYTGNVISAYLDLHAALGIGSWLSSKVVTLTVEVPAKSIRVHNQAVVYTDTTKTLTRTMDVVNILPVGGNAAYAGYWFADPRYSSTLRLPSQVTCLFEGGTQKTYPVAWDTESGIVTYADGVYSLFSGIFQNTANANLYEIKSSIGEGAAKYEFSITVVQIPTGFSDVTFDYTDGTVSGTGTDYVYTVNAFSTSFAVPNTFRLSYPTPIVIGTGGRTYNPQYTITPHSGAGNLLRYQYSLGDGSNNTIITLDIAAASYTVTDLTLAAASGAITSTDGGGSVTPLGITINNAAKTISVTGLNVDANGQYHYSLGGADYSVDVMEFVEWLLTSDTTLTYSGGISNYATLTGFRKSFSVQNLSGSGQEVVLRLSVVPGILDYAVTVSGSVQAAVTGVDSTVTLYQYTATGEEIYKNSNGYALSTDPITVYIGGVATVVRNLVWRVDSTSESITGSYAENSVVTHIARETIYGKHATQQWIMLYSHLSDGTKVSRTVNIPALDWSKYSSLDTYRGDFAIVDGVITINNMFNVALNNVQVILNQLPTSIRFYNLLVENVVWSAAPAAAEKLALLNHAIGYPINADPLLDVPFVFARATVNVVGYVDISLRIVFEPCDFDTDIDTLDVELAEYAGVANTFDATTDTLRIEIQPYLTDIALNGYYHLDRSLTFLFAGGASYAVTNAVYYAGGVALSSYDLAFGYDGFSGAIAVGDTRNTKHFTVVVGYGLTINVEVVVASSIVPAGDTVEIDGVSVELSRVQFGRVRQVDTVVLNGGAEYYVNEYGIVYSGVSVGTVNYAARTLVVEGRNLTFAGTEIFENTVKVGEFDLSTATLRVSGTMYVFLYDTVYASAGSATGGTFNIASTVYYLSGTELFTGRTGSGTAQNPYVYSGSAGRYAAKGTYETDTPLPYAAVTVIDPYAVTAKIGAEEHYLPPYVLIDFGSGNYTAVAVNWNLGEFSVQYTGTESNLLISGTLVGAGIGSQTIYICVSVANRSQVTSIGLFDHNSATLMTPTSGMANFTMYVTDPLEFDAGDLPKYAIINEGGTISLLDIEWTTTAADFKVGGGAVEITGHIVRNGVGQILSLTVIADSYTFVSIWRPTDMSNLTGGVESDYTLWTYGSLMSPVSFTFVGLNGIRGEYHLGYRAYKVLFSAKDLNPASPTYEQTRIVVKYFVPSIYAAVGDNILYFDQAAVTQADTSGTQQTASFYLGATGKTSVTVNGARYLVTEPQVYEDSVTYRYVTTGTEEAPYVLVDPLNPDLPTEAYAYTNWSELSKIKFAITSTTSFENVNLNSYIGGGILLGKRFTFTLLGENDEALLAADGTEIRFSVYVKILFTDRSVIGATQVASHDTTDADGNAITIKTIDVSFKSDFLLTTYEEGQSPYTGYHTDGGVIINALKVSLAKYGATATIIVTYDAEGRFVSFALDGYTKTFNYNVLSGVTVENTP